MSYIYNYPEDMIGEEYWIMIGVAILIGKSKANQPVHRDRLT